MMFVWVSLDILCAGLGRCTYLVSGHGEMGRDRKLMNKGGVVRETFDNQTNANRQKTDPSSPRYRRHNHPLRTLEKPRHASLT